MTPQNHHDFLDVIKNQRDSIEGISKGDGHGFSRLLNDRKEDRAQDLLANDRIVRAHRNYKNMKLNAIVLPTKPRSKVNQDALAERGRARLKLHEEQKRQKQMEWVQSLTI